MFEIDWDTVRVRIAVKTSGASVTHLFRSYRKKIATIVAIKHRPSMAGLLCGVEHSWAMKIFASAAAAR
jgi:hypothetical protein